jgi:hypothetical protein
MSLGLFKLSRRYLNSKDHPPNDQLKMKRIHDLALDSESIELWLLLLYCILIFDIDYDFLYDLKLVYLVKHHDKVYEHFDSSKKISILHD